MDESRARWIDEVRAGFGDQCFACGRDNAEGLHLDDWDVVADEVRAVFRPRSEHVGAGDTLHGGLAATVLDEALVWAGIYFEFVLTVTGTLDLKFRRPMTVLDEIIAVGRVDSRSGKRLRLSGHLETAAGLTAEASGLYLVARPVPRPDGQPGERS